MAVGLAQRTMTVMEKFQSSKKVFIFFVCFKDEALKRKFLWKVQCLMSWARFSSPSRTDDDDILSALNQC